MKFVFQILLIIFMFTIFSCKQDPTGLDQFYPNYNIAFMYDKSSGGGVIELFDIFGRQKQTLIDSVAQAFFVEWSNDVKNIIYTQALGVPSELYLFNTETQISMLLFHSINWAVAYIQFSLDGERIKFTTNQLFTIDKNGENLTQITDTNDKVGYSAWFPNENKIIFGSKRTNNYEIYTIDVDNNNRTQVTSDLNYNHIFSSISFDGRKVLFIRSDLNKNFWEDDTKQLFKLDHENQELINLGLDSFSGVPAWSPDASKIMFKKRVGEIHHIFIMDDDGSNQLQLTNDDKSYGNLKWLPDGSGIIGISGTDFYLIGLSGVQKIKSNFDDIHRINGYAISPQKF